ncbi:MAG: response regulator transcription factor [Candidatus Izimaplasma sp.]|nr:response regulator transcription factor [Candidatus Izimaplasma bacterium]
MRILIVEDERHLNDVLFDYVLDKYDFAIIDQIYDGLEALISIQENNYDLVLLDVMLPNVDGFEICKKLREKANTPVIMLSALSDEENQLRGYNLGIDEYITKPYSPKLVVKKIEAILGRYNEIVDEDYKQYGYIKYNIDKHKILVDGNEIKLNKKEWDLFVLFINNTGRVFSRDHLLNKVWGYDYFGDARTVDTHIKRLRKKLNNASVYVKTIFKEGYKFEK